MRSIGTSSLTGTLAEAATAIAVPLVGSNNNVVKLSFLETTTDNNTNNISNNKDDNQQADQQGVIMQPSSPSSTPTPSPTPILFLHGLDSSSHTWKNVLDDLSSNTTTTTTTSNHNKQGLNNHNYSCYKAVALDQRGCGNSLLGDPDQFTPEAIVNDIHQFLLGHPYFCDCDESTNSNSKNTTTTKIITPFVLVGHSMGGRVAMSFAATYPELIAALIIEDMDVRQRPLTESRTRSLHNNRTKTVNFDRCMHMDNTTNKLIQNDEDVVAVFVNEGYPESQVRKWLKEGRVTKKKKDGDYYSQVNPAFRLLCYEQFFETNHGEDTWLELVRILTSATTTTTNTNTNTKKTNDQNVPFSFPIHVMIADPKMTVCDEESISFMENAFINNNTAATTTNKCNKHNNVNHESKEYDDGSNASTTCTSLPTSSSSSLLTFHRYKGATHSIHNSVSEQFMSDLKTIIHDVT